MAPGYGDDDADRTTIGADAETLLAPMDEDDDDFDFAKTEALPPEAFTGSTSLDETNEMPAVAGTDMDLDLDDLTAALQVSAAGDTVEQVRDDATVEQPRPSMGDETSEIPTMSLGPEDMSDDLHEARTMTEVGTKLDLARAYVDMGDPAGARSILEEVLDEGDEGQRQQAQQLLDSLPS
jgi:pilus assembly protein FimV